MTIRRRLLIIAGCCLLVLLLWGVWRSIVLWMPSSLRAGPDTTVVDGPLKANGRVDYEAALHARCSTGIVPEENAACLLAQAFGPAEIPVELRARYYQYLGIPELPIEGEYLLNEDQFAASQAKDPKLAQQQARELFDEMSQTTQHPWNRAEFPRIVAWIEVNRAPLALIEKASLRPKCYSPLVTAADLQNAPPALNQNMRSIVRLLVSRAMLHIAEEDLTAAAHDLVTCHRLACLLNQNATITDSLVSYALASQARQGTEILLAQPLTVEQIDKYRAEIFKLPPFKSIWEAVDQSERFVTLDGIQAIWKGRRIGHDTESLDGMIHLGRFDVNVVLRRCNRYYDDVIQEMKREGFRDRLQGLQKVVDEKDRRAKVAVAPARVIGRLAWYSRTGYSESIGDILLRVLSPVVVQFQHAADRATMHRELLHVGLALAAYRAKHGHYPDQLELLKPDLLKTVPVDRYIDQPLHYKLRPNGYTLYSVGPDEKDNGGQPLKGMDQGDLVFEVTHSPKP